MIVLLDFILLERWIFEKCTSTISVPEVTRLSIEGQRKKQQDRINAMKGFQNTTKFSKAKSASDHEVLCATRRNIQSLLQEHGYGSSIVGISKNPANTTSSICVDSPQELNEITSAELRSIVDQANCSLSLRMGKESHLFQMKEAAKEAGTTKNWFKCHLELKKIFGVIRVAEILFMVAQCADSSLDYYRGRPPKQWIRIYGQDSANDSKLLLWTEASRIALSCLRRYWQQHHSRSEGVVQHYETAWQRPWR